MLLYLTEHELNMLELTADRYDRLELPLGYKFFADRFTYYLTCCPDGNWYYADAFRNISGERFTQIVNKTQVLENVEIEIGVPLGVEKRVHEPKPRPIGSSRITYVKRGGSVRTVSGGRADGNSRH